ncbi:MAG: EAL domain-containing protein [Ruminococcus sp.]|nr:EAL domain-containing protein [Ruminococcus sp.]
MDSQFYALFEEFLHSITQHREIDLESISSVIAPLCKYLGISKTATSFYDNPRAEALGDGRTIVCYDSGVKSVEAHVDRVETEAYSVTKTIIYRSADSDEWDEITKRNVELFTNVMILAVSRSTLLQVAKQRTFYDDSSYLNINYFIKYIERNGPQGLLKGNAVVFFNLRHFTLINQQIGRDRGNVVMRGFVDKLIDIVGNDGFISRMGGDNFIGVISKDKLDKSLEHIRGCAVPYNSYGDRIMVYATAGVFVMDDSFVYSSPSSVLDRVMPAAQAARLGGMDDIVFFSAEMERRKDKTMRLQRLFPQALENEEFLIYYQPKVDIHTGRLVGAEALCRWLREGEIIKPEEFIPTYEQSLDICKLDLYMLDHVCSDIKKWLAEGKEVVRISVNLSRKHMIDVDLVDHIISIIDKHGVPHEYIEIELTETTTDVEFKDLKRVVSGLQKAGISTAVDDFGIGYSSLNLISEIPWNVIKLDKSLIPLKTDSDTSPRRVMFSHVVKMAKEMGLECISEGVESEDQISTMLENGCDIVQGFFYDRPLPKAAFIERMIAKEYK